jgi:hypothetical protein
MISQPANQPILSWATTSDGFVLESANSLAEPVTWVAVTNRLSTNGPNFVFNISGSARAAFYRLHYVLPSPNAIIAPAETWTWVDFTNCYCMEGTTTGIGVNLVPNSKNVLIFLNGGGACWDYTTCYLLNTATHGPFGQTEFNNVLPSLSQIWFLDRTSTNNPFQDYSYILVPYCTGDVHAGSRIDTYNGKVTMQVGYENLANYLERIVATFPGAQHVVLSGSSAGGFGATFNWAQTQQAFGNARVDLIDDSGPILEPDTMAQGSGLFLPGSTPLTNWDISAAIPQMCVSCATNMASLYAFVSGSAPPHRVALLSYTQDSTISAYYQLSTSVFNAGLNELVATEFGAYANLAYFFVSGQSHTLLESGTVGVNNVTVQQFITQMVTDDPAWASQHP